ncbi:MAG: hypothetical protein J6R99_00770 [Alphaproteobacteria bacterium]|nr:hypothetical protein [Alphaproteobacteria bacterium]
MNLRNRLPFFLAYAQKKPSKPIFLEYVEFDGKSYIDTGYYPNGLTTSIYYSFAHNSPDVKGIFGSRQAYGVCTYCAFYVGAKLRVDWVNASATNFSIEKSVKYDLNINNGSISLNDEIVGTYTLKNEQALYPMYLGTVNDNGTPYANALLQKVYGFKIYENNLLIQDLRPALDPRGVVCFYDTVSGQYFYNQGTGTLKAGGRFVESILFDGACVVDTGITHQTCKIECDIRFEETGTRQLMGFGTGSGQYWGAGSTGIFDYMAGTNALDRTDVVIDFNAEQINYTIYADGKSRTSANGNALSSLTYRIGAGPTGKESNSYWCTCQVWGQKTYIGGELIQDLRPYVDSDGVACFKDVVTDTLFYNKGTGTLTYTEFEELEYLELDGTQYIDTGIVYQTCDVECRIKFHETGTRQLMGFSGASSVHYWGLSTSGVFEPLTSVSASGFTDVRIEYNKDNPDAKTITMIVGDKTATKTGKIDTDKSYLIGCLDGTDYWCTCEIKHNKIYIGGKLVQDLIPVKRSDGVKCMYDRVENKYYELKGA